MGTLFKFFLKAILFLVFLPLKLLKLIKLPFKLIKLALPVAAGWAIFRSLEKRGEQVEGHSPAALS